MYVNAGSFVGNGTSQVIETGLSTGFGVNPDLVIVHVSGQIAVFHVRGMAPGKGKPAIGSTALLDNCITLNGDGTFTVGSAANVNQNGSTVRWEAFSDAPNSIAVGSYAGDGTTPRTVTLAGGASFTPTAGLILSEGAHPVQYRTNASPADCSQNFDGIATGNTTRLRAFGAGSFELGSSTFVNAAGGATTYWYVMFADQAGVFKALSEHVGTGASAALSGFGFAPTGGLTKGENTGTGALRCGSMGGDNGASVGTAVDATGRWTSLDSDGWTLGTLTTAGTNVSGIAYRQIAWRTTLPPGAGGGTDDELMLTGVG